MSGGRGRVLGGPDLPGRARKPVVWRSMATVPADLVEFLESGVSILVGTRDAEGRPEVARGVGASLAPGRDAMTLYLQQVWGARALANLRATRELAVTFSRPLDNLSVQLKGPCTRWLCKRSLYTGITAFPGIKP